MTRVRSEDLETGAVTRRAIRPGAVGRDQLDPRLAPGGAWWQGAIGRGMLGAGAVSPGTIAPGAVQAPQLEDGSVTAPAIRDGSVTAPAIADGAVTSPKVPAGALGARELANGSLTLPKFAQGTRPVQIVDGLPIDPLGQGFLPGDAVVDVSGDDAKIWRIKLPWDRWDALDDTWNAAEPWPISDWTAQVDTFDLRGLLQEGNFGDDIIVARMVAANQIGATELAAIYVEVDKWIRSFNWDPGVAGWAIDGNGNAEFNDVTIRGGLLVGGTLSTSALVSADYVAGSAGWALDPAGNTEFNDVTIRGSVLVGGTITAVDLKSDNYTAGSSGWALDGNGNAELNDATFRGNIKASSVTSGQLVSSNYLAGSAGWALDANGNAEFNDVTIRGGALVGGSLDLVVSSGGIWLGDTDRHTIRFYRDSTSYGQITYDTLQNQLKIDSAAGLAGDVAIRGDNVIVSALNEILLDVDTTANNILNVGDRVIPVTDGGSANVYCGDSTHRFTSFWGVDTTINSSDVTAKTDVAPIGRLDAQSRVRALGQAQAPISFRWPNRVRTHAGFDAAKVGQVHGDRSAAFVDPVFEADDLDAEANTAEANGDIARADRLREEARAVRAAPKGLRIGELVPDLYVVAADLLERVEALEAA